MSSLRFQVTDLLAHPGTSRMVSGTTQLRLQVGESAVTGPATVEARLESILEGIMAGGEAVVESHHQCARCLREWEAQVVAPFRELFLTAARADWPDDEQYSISADGYLDLEPLVHDEISLALPPDPLCRPDCAGLCPICGADLNTGLCAGHGDETRSPFAVLGHLFDPET